MAKVENMPKIVKELRSAAASINAAADKLSQMVECEDASSKQSQEKSAKTEIKMEDVRAVLADKSREGHTAAVRALLQKFGADKLSEIDPAKYEDLLKAAEEIGNGR